jgi:hypothetical protein
MKTYLLKVLCTVLFPAATALAAETKSDHIMLTPKQLQWKAGPESLPPGAKAVVIEGDPSAAAPFTMRFQVPANYKIMPHWHPIVEHVTVLEGTCQMGMGTEFRLAALFWQYTWVYYSASWRGAVGNYLCKPG